MWLEQRGCGVRFHRAVGSPLDSLERVGGGRSGKVLEQGDQIWQLYGTRLEGKGEKPETSCNCPRRGHTVSPQGQVVGSDGVPDTAERSNPQEC